jgi:hypothetical protein
MQLSPVRCCSVGPLAPYPTIDVGHPRHAGIAGAAAHDAGPIGSFVAALGWMAGMLQRRNSACGTCRLHVASKERAWVPTWENQ